MGLLCIRIIVMIYRKRMEIMSTQIELLRIKLEKLVAITDNLFDSEVVSLSQKLDNLIYQYYLYESKN